MRTVSEKIRERLFLMQDLEYREFQAKLIPTIEKEKIIGIRAVQMQKLVKEIAKLPQIGGFLDDLPHQYYDENNLHMLVIGEIKEYEECLKRMEEFLPYIDNWATCDCKPPKVFARHREELLPAIYRWIDSGQTYVIRFGIGMLMRFYLDDLFQVEYAEKVAQIRSEEYYVNMMIAWYFATALAKQYDAVLPYLKEERLDFWTHNKTIQKARESNRITLEQKEYLKIWKRKKKE